MQAQALGIDPGKYARCVEVSRRVRWDIDQDVIRGRAFDFRCKFLPDGLSLADRLPFLTGAERITYSQVQGRTYANMFRLVERFIGAKVLEISRGHWLGDQVALEALVRFSEEELKHQELFRRLERMAAAGMPASYTFSADPNAVAAAVLSKSTWAVLALTCLIELFTLAHYRSSIEPDSSLSELWKDVFLNHWKEESQHAIVDELEWIRHDATLTAHERDAAVNDLVDLVGAVDGILVAQAGADAAHFLDVAGRAFTQQEEQALRANFLAAYRWQYIGTGVKNERFQMLLRSMVTAAQMERITRAVTPLLGRKDQ